MQPLRDQPFSSIYTFGEFTLDTANFRVLKGGEQQKMTPRAFEVLLLLVENTGRVVSKQEIFDGVWGETFVTDNALTRMVKEVRQVLGDNAESPVYIETVPKRGYRFLLPVARMESSRVGPQDVMTYQRVSVEEEIIEVDDSDDVEHAADRSARFHPSDEPKALPPAARAPFAPWWIWALAALGLLAVAGFGIYRYVPAGGAGGIKTSIARLTANGKVNSLALSPDGKFAAFTASGDQRQTLWLKNIKSGTESQIQLPDDHRMMGNLAFSRDGDFIYYVSGGSLYKVSVLGDTPKKVRADLNSSPITFSPDGRQFAYLVTPAGDQERSDLVIADTETGADVKVVASSRRPDMFLLSPAWSPDGRLIALAMSNAAGTGIATVGVEDAAITMLPLPPTWSPTVGQVVWRPDGKSLLVTVEEYKNVLTQIWSISYPSGEARRVTDDSHNYRTLSISSDGRFLAGIRTEQDAHLWLMPATGEAGQAKQITTGFEKYDGVFSIDWVGENELVYSNAPSGKLAVWRTSTDGKGGKEIWPEGRFAAASPDGQILVYQVEDGPNTGLFRVDLKDGAKKRLTTGGDESPVFTPDGKWVIFTRFGGDVALWRVPIDGSAEPVRLTDFAGYPENASVSPDGKLIAFYRGTNGQMRFPQLAVIPFEGGKPVKEFDVNIFFLNIGYARKKVQWTPDGQAVYHIPFRPPINIWRQPIDGSPATQVTQFQDGVIFNYAFSPGGKQLAISRGTLARDAVMITDF